jgi:hypothetical protein
VLKTREAGTGWADMLDETAANGCMGAPDRNAWDELLRPDATEPLGRPAGVARAGLLPVPSWSIAGRFGWPTGELKVALLRVLGPAGTASPPRTVRLTRAKLVALACPCTVTEELCADALSEIDRAARPASRRERVYIRVSWAREHGGLSPTLA